MGPTNRIQFVGPICNKMEHEMSRIAKRISKFTTREIDHLFGHARSFFKDESCTILLAPRQGEFGRILIVTSRKVGNAPERNFIRRRVKAIFYEEKLYERTVDCVIIAKKKLVGLSFSQLKDILLEAYRKLMQRHENSSRPASQ